MSTRYGIARLTLLAGTALSTWPLTAGELPTGGTVTHGSVGISTPAQGRMAIRQSSDSAIVAWKSFSIGSDARVDIRQPSADSAILNRVTGSATSRIDGQLNANGRVYLVNPNGIAIGASGTVRAGSFVASTLDIRDDDFIQGRHEFRGDGTSAAVENRGTIEIGPGGYAALIGGRIDNSGIVSVPLGRIGLGAGELVTLDLSGDGFLSVALPSEGAGDEPLIAQSGRLSADGGRVEIRAAAARQAARQAINLSGVVEARTVSGRNGAIVLGGGGGTVRVSGRLDASARQPEASPAPKPRPQGGAIDVTGAEVVLAGAQIDASGLGGGGLVRVGGDYQGKGDLPRATTTAVDAASLIAADALGSGDGGRVIVWSDALTLYDGTITARGGPEGGNGGFAEVSGKARLAFAGHADLSAARGSFGTLLLDPFNIVISDDLTTVPFPFDVGIFESAVDSSILNATQLENELALANIIVQTGDGPSSQGAGFISVEADLQWNSGNTLTLDADSDIFIENAISAGLGGGLTLNANDDIIINGKIDAPGGTLTFRAFDSFDGGETIDVNGAITATNGTIEMLSFGNVIALSGAVEAGTINLDASTEGTPGDIIVNGPLTITGLGNITIFGNDVTLGGEVTAGIRNIDVSADDDIVVNAAISGNDVTLAADNSGEFDTPAISGNGAISGDSVNLTANDGSIDFGGAITGAIVGISAFTTGGPGTSGSVLLSGPIEVLGGGPLAVSANNSVSVAAVTASGPVLLEAVGGSVPGSVSLTGPLTANLATVSLVSTGGGITLGGPISVQNGTLTLNEQAGAAIVTTGAATVDVGTFSLVGGTWEQIAGALPEFSATDFRLTDPASFLRAEGGDGTASGSAYLIGDVFGLQGMTLSPSGEEQHYALARNIAASGTSGWNAGAGFVPTARVASLDGNGFAIDRLFINLPGNRPGEGDVGLLGGSSPGSEVRDLGLTNVNITGGTRTGALLGTNDGLVENVYSTGQVRNVRTIAGGGAMIVGGLVGYNRGEIVRGEIVHSYSTATVSSEQQPAVTGTANAGGLVGLLLGSIEESYATGDVNAGTGSLAISGNARAGGLVGVIEPAGSIVDSYASGDPSAFSTLTAHAGGLVAINTGSVERSLSSGAVTSLGAGATLAGGLIGENQGALATSFWDAQASGIATPAAGATGLTTSELHDTEGFMALAGAAGWDFETVWAPSQPGFYADLYAVSPVVRISAADATATYGSVGQVPLTGTVYGGPGVYVNASADDSIPEPYPLASPGFPDGNAGVHAIAASSPNVISELGDTYRLVVDPGELTVDRAPLTIAANDQSKLVGQTFTFAGTEFASTGLVSGDSVGSVLLMSPGAPAGASVGEYVITASNAEGTGLSNYNIVYVPGEFTVLPVEPPEVVDVPFAPRFAPAISLPQPTDTLQLAALEIGGGPPPDALGRAETTLDTLTNLGGSLEAAVEACRRSEPDVEAYLACLGTELDKYAAALDAMSLDLPDSLRGVSAIIERASDRIASARATAVGRLATAQTEAEAEQIGREAVAEAQAAISQAQAEIQQAIALIRAEEPELARLEVAQGNAITAALDSVGTSLERSVGL